MIGGVSVALIDGMFLQNVCKNMQVDLDYSGLLNGLKERYNIVRPYFYKAVEGPDENNYHNFRKLQDYLLYNSYDVITHEVRSRGDSKHIDTSSIETKMACDIIHIAYNMRNIDHIIVVASNRNYAEAIDLVKHLGIQVTVLGNHNHDAERTHARLRKSADSFDELFDLIIDSKADNNKKIDRNQLGAENWHTETDEDEDTEDTDEIESSYYILYADDGEESVHEGSDPEEIVSAAQNYTDDLSKHKFTVVDDVGNSFHSLNEFKIVHGIEQQSNAA